MSNDQVTGAPREQAAEPGAAAGGGGGGERRLVMKALIAINAMVALITSVMIVAADGFSPSGLLLDGVSSLHEWGEMSGRAVDGGEYWRLVTTMFLHYGLLHLLANMVLLWLAARKLEPVLGSGRFLVVYLLSGLGSSTAIYYADHSVLTAGASGAVFGLFTALLVASLRLKLNLWLPLILLAFGVVTTFALPGMSVAAHAGGLLVGAVVACGYLLARRDAVRLAVPIATAVVLLVLVALQPVLA
ncbi:rhomboid family intramembrane serine protease [Microtetraspora fusca]|uniref:rhomboid family intramembrane serine protease n=1 Tax=Microtetraspora fusca TaxID=1997 RepID=UPI0008337CDB|nr:rhomboid family intramembrane serine protease [Microtetraspora fusca]